MEWDTDLSPFKVLFTYLRITLTHYSIGKIHGRAVLFTHDFFAIVASGVRRNDDIIKT